MIVLNIYGKIKPICISNKLKLYLGNLPNEKENDWNSMLLEELFFCIKTDKIHQERYGYESKICIEAIHKKVVSNSELKKSATTKERAQEIVDNMICLYFDYKYDDMPLGGWEENPFDGRLCEKDYAEFIVDFWNKMDEKSMPNWIYSSNIDRDIPYYRMFMPQSNFSDAITNLLEWGKNVDNFLQDRNDYLEFDYLIRTVSDEDGNDVYQFFKWYSLCQLFLENEHEKELDWKLPNFLALRYSQKEREKMAEIFRKMRNKIAHGDFLKFEELVEEYAKNFMDGKFSFDYSELSRKSWAIQNAMFVLMEAVKHMIHVLFTNRNLISVIKKKKNKEEN